jgi:hypothetical protein
MPNVRFAVGIQRLIPFLGYHHVLMILIALAIILLCKFCFAAFLSFQPNKKANNLPQHYYWQAARHPRL